MDKYDIAGLTVTVLEDCDESSTAPAPYEPNGPRVIGGTLDKREGDVEWVRPS